MTEKPLGTLRAPVGSNFPRAPAPQVLRIFFKEHGIKLLPETVDIEILQGVFCRLEATGGQITEARLHRGQKAHVLKGFPFQGIG